MSICQHCFHTIAQTNTISSSFQSQNVYFDSKTSSLHWKFKIRHAWIQQNRVSTLWSSRTEEEKQTSTCEGLLICLRPVEVALGDVGPLDAHLPHLASRQGLVVLVKRSYLCIPKSIKLLSQALVYTQMTHLM